MRKVKARWFWLAFFLTLSPLWNLSNPALAVSLDVINFALLMVAIVKSVIVVKASFAKKKEVIK